MATSVTYEPNPRADERGATVVRGIVWLTSVVLLFLGGWLTSLGLGGWYYELNFPPYQPPSWLFTPVWICVLTLLAHATNKLLACQGSRVTFGAAVGLYGGQCVLNVGWSLLFFTLRRPDLALWNILALDVVLGLMIFAYSGVSRSAGRLLVPYLVWLLYATSINAWIVLHNSF